MESQPPDLDKYTLGPSIEDLELRQYTYQEVATLKRVTVQTVMEWVKTGKIPSPVYTGFTARFTTEQLTAILTENNPAGTYPVTPSPRAEIGKLGGSAKKPRKGKAKNPAQQTMFAKKPMTRTTKSPKPKPKPTKKPKPKPKPFIIDAGGGVLVEVAEPKSKKKRGVK